MMGWAIEQVLLYEALGLAALIVLLALRRAIRSWLRARANARTMRRGGVKLFPLVLPVRPQATPVQSETTDVAERMQPQPVAPEVRPRASVVAEVRPPAPFAAQGRASATGGRPLERARLETDDATPTAGEFLAQAETRLAAGERDKAAADLRSCLRVAHKSKEPEIEARARLALGDIARASGDLTSACEHWQMARVLFAQISSSDAVHATVERMERAGCPTDWVLTEF